MLKPSKISLVALAILTVSLNACKQEILTPETPLTQARQSAVAAGGTLSHLDLPLIYQQASKLDDASWLELPATAEVGGFPVRQLRRSPMLPRDAKFYTTDGKQLFEQARPALMVVEGLTAEGRRGCFALSPEHFAGWYEAEEGRMYVQDLAFDHPEAESGELVTLSEAAWQQVSPVAGQCGSPNEPGKPAHIGAPSLHMAEANCWKLELIMHGDWHYFSGPAGRVVNNANFGLAAFAVLSDPPYAAINMDLVVTNYVLTTTPTNFTTNTRLLLNNHVQPFWASFPTNRDAVLYISGANLTSASAGTGALGEAFDFRRVCVNTAQSVAVCEWQRGPLSSPGSPVVLTQSQANGRLGAHELGHLLDARHTGSGLMTSAMLSTSGSGNFSQTSRDQMNWHLWFNNGCLYQATCN
jgi:hypothetical protein